jgi:hypothetical protein
MIREKLIICQVFIVRSWKQKSILKKTIDREQGMNVVEKYDRKPFMLLKSYYHLHASLKKSIHVNKSQQQPVRWLIIMK